MTVTVHVDAARLADGEPLAVCEDRRLLARCREVAILDRDGNVAARVVFSPLRSQAPNGQTRAWVELVTGRLRIER